MCSSQRRNVYTLREAEHVQAHTVEKPLARLEHHNRNGSQDDCMVIVPPENISEFIAPARKIEFESC